MSRPRSSSYAATPGVLRGRQRISFRTKCPGCRRELNAATRIGLDAEVRRCLARDVEKTAADERRAAKAVLAELQGELFR